MHRRALALVALLALLPVGSTVLAKGLTGAARPAVSAGLVTSFPTATAAQAVPGIVAPPPVAPPAGAAASLIQDAGPPDAFVVATHLMMAGLPVSSPEVVTTATDPDHLLGQAGQYGSRVLFRDGRISGAAARTVDAGGSVEAFRTATDLRGRQVALQASQNGRSQASEHDLVAGQVLLRLSAQLTPDQAAAYELALPAALQHSSIIGG